MAGVTWPSIFSAVDETNERLNGLLHAERNRRRDGHRDLEAAVARLDATGSFTPSDEVDPLPRERRDERDGRSAVPSDPVPFVALPRRSTHGGPWGPKVREKLTAIALDRESRRW
jgi:hypothetical protein